MATRHLEPVLRYLRQVISGGPAEDSSTELLLQQFVSQRDERAFAGIMERYGPMVLGVCRRMLRDPHEAEDAFQATFMVLARKAGSVKRAGALGMWLYRVAYHVAVQARERAAKRPVQEGEPVVYEDKEHAWLDVQPALDEELQRLPAKYLAPLRLYYLEGKSTEEAARELGWPKGTLLSRLDRGRDLLRDRLTRRGVGVTTGMLATLLAENAAPAACSPELIAVTATAAAGFAAGGSAALSGTVAVLTFGAMRNMLIAKLRMVVPICVALLLLVGGAGAVLHNGSEGEPQASKPRSKRRPQAGRTMKPVESQGVLEGMASDATLSRNGRYLAVSVPDFQPGGAGGNPGAGFGFGGGIGGGGIGGGGIGGGGIGNGFMGKSAIRVIDLKTLRSISQLPDEVTGFVGQGKSPWSMQIGTQGKLLIVPDNPFGGMGGGLIGGAGLGGFGGGNGKGMEVWDVVQRKRRFKLPAATRGAQMTLDGKSIVTLQDGGDIRIYDTTTGKQQRSWQAVESTVPMMGPFMLAPDDRTLAFAAFDSKLAKTGVYFWDIAGRKRYPVLYLPTKKQVNLGNLNLFSISADGKFFAYPQENEVVVWDVAGGRELRRLPVDDTGETVTASLAFSPAGSCLAAYTGILSGGFGGGAAGGKGELIVWDAVSGKEKFRIKAGPKKGEFVQSVFSGIVFSPDGSLLAAAEQSWKDRTSFRYRVRIWNVATGRNVADLPDQTSVIGFALKSRNSSLLLTVPAPRPDMTAEEAVKPKIQIWEVQNGN